MILIPQADTESETAPPAIGLPGNIKLTLRAGSTSTIAVPFTGKPQPMVTWHFNDTPKLPDRCQHYEDSGSAVMTLNSVSKLHDGAYKAVIKNDSGKEELAVFVTVIGKILFIMLHGGMQIICLIDLI